MGIAARTLLIRWKRFSIPCLGRIRYLGYSFLLQAQETKHGSYKQTAQSDTRITGFPFRKPKSKILVLGAAPCNRRLVLHLASRANFFDGYEKVSSRV